MPIPALTTDKIQQGLAGILDNVDGEQANLISSALLPSAIELIKILLDTLKQGKLGLPCDTQMIGAQQVVKTLYDVAIATKQKKEN